MRASLTVLLLASLALAGCAESGPTPYTCSKTGTVIDLATVAGSDEEGFDPESACPDPVPPALTFKDLPATVGAYQSATLSWTVTNGSYLHGHAMETSVRMSTKSVPTSELAGPETYGTSLAKREHQELPQTFTASHTFGAPATLYLRLHGVIRGDGLEDTDFWSNETVLTVSPVTPTGKTVTFTHAPGDLLGTVEPAGGTLDLGDQVAFANEDAKEHVFTFTSAPPCFDHEPVTVAAVSGVSDPILLPCPGNYKVGTDDVQPKTFEIVVRAPAK